MTRPKMPFGRCPSVTASKVCCRVKGRRYSRSSRSQSALSLTRFGHYCRNRASMLAMNSGALSRQEPAQVCPMRHPVCHRGLAQVGHELSHPLA